jgi:hypothetical protein
MKPYVSAILLAAALFGWAVARPQGYQVVVHPSSEVTALSPKELGAIYLGVKLFWNGDRRIVPALLQDSAPATQAFFNEVLHLKADQFHSHWRRRVFSGSGMAPRTFRTPEELRAFVEGTPGAIGVVEPSDAPTQLKVVRMQD